jgi:hypothetical protein
MGGLAVPLGLTYLAYGGWTSGTILGLVLLILLSLTAVWLYLAIRWIDRKQGWAEQQAPKGAVPRKTAPTAPDS